jgi:hypothetical protein
VTTRTATSVLDAPAGDVFDYLAQVDNLPDWATEFARELRWDRAGASVVNGLGEFRVRFATDRRSGVIDIYVGRTEHEMALFPSRVVALPDGRSAYTFTMFESPGGSHELFEAQYASLLREFENIRRRFAQDG